MRIVRPSGGVRAVHGGRRSRTAPWVAGLRRPSWTGHWRLEDFRCHLDGCHAIRRPGCGGRQQAYLRPALGLLMAEKRRAASGE